ncbi:MAG: U32 family peptidase C-terminal domain-containing protein [Endomicrobium sp.]|jgi:putative protease|nr:U32 family peptidase C-terminal domain-containing protein [Endomicrobium sp.]
MKKPELLLPAGSLSKLKTAFLYGADAVYAGTPDMSLRAKSQFPLDELEEGIKFARNIGKKVYLALNLFSHNSDVEKLPSFINALKALRPDGIIISDPGVFSYVKNEIPKAKIRVSTQANVCSHLTVNFWKSMGADLCVLGREVSFAEACEIRKKCGAIGLEIFVHGSMCVSYSGRCLMSAFMAGRSANKGNCAHSCRWKYKSKLLLEEELRPGEYMELCEDERGSYIFNSKDLCLMPKLLDILGAGFDSLKIEGRNKSQYYAAQTARVYRKAIDDCFNILSAGKENVWNSDIYMQELQTLQNRGYSLGFFDGMPNSDAQDYLNTSSKSGWRNAGVVVKNSNNELTVELRHKIKKGDEIEILSPFKFEPEKIVLDKIYDAQNGSLVEEIAPGKVLQAVKIQVKTELSPLFPENTIMRIKL